MRNHPSDGPRLPALLINMDHNRDRLTAVESAFGAKLPFRRVPGVRGSQIPDSAVSRLVSPSIGATQWAGVLGCTLSHVAAMETMLALGLPQCLILEDDARPAPDFEARLDRLQIPSDFDLCFVNNRMLTDETTSDIVLSTADGITKFPSNYNAPGSDGYIITESAARALLEWFSEDGYGHFTDWRLLAYTIQLSDCEKLDKLGTPWALLEPLQRAIPRQGRLRGYIAQPSLTIHAGESSALMIESEEVAKLRGSR